MDVEEVARLAVDCGLKVHRKLGPGLLESVYEAALGLELHRAGLTFRRQVVLPVVYDGMALDETFRIDLLIENCLIVEIKSVERIAPVHGKQLLTYLRLAEQPVGLLLNFGCATFSEGIKRVVNRHTDFASSRLRVNQQTSQP